MADSNNEPEASLADEIQALGKNLSQAFRTAWDNPERKRVQEQVTISLTDLGSTLKREADNLSTSPASQQIKTEFEKLGDKVRSSDAQDKIRRELLGALHVANSELQKVIDRWATQPGAAAPDATGAQPEAGQAPPPDDSQPRA
jgi:hypothetical protein